MLKLSNPDLRNPIYGDIYDRAVTARRKVIASSSLMVSAFAAECVILNVDEPGLLSQGMAAMAIVGAMVTGRNLVETQKIGKEFSNEQTRYS